MKLRDYIQQNSYQNTRQLGDVLMGAIEIRQIGNFDEAQAMFDAEFHAFLRKLGVTALII